MSNGECLSRSVGFFSTDKFLNHQPGEPHIERPARLQGILHAIEESDVANRLVRLPFGPCDEETLRLAHSDAYLQLAKTEIASGRDTLSTGDTDVCRESWDAAIWGAGAACAAVDAVMTGQTDVAFCAVRPPGHHATRTRGMGFCIVNHVAIAARHAQHHHGIERVLIVDWDVHHGNGTQDIFYEDPSVLFFSTHQAPFYPGTGAASETGAGPAVGTTINVPLPIGSRGVDLFAAVESKLLPTAASFQPQLVCVSAGFDARAGDPVGGFQLEDSDFVRLTELVLQIADQYSRGRLVSLLEGGYSIRGLASATTAHLRALLGQDP